MYKTNDNILCEYRKFIHSVSDLLNSYHIPETILGLLLMGGYAPVKGWELIVNKAVNQYNNFQANKYRNKLDRFKYVIGWCYWIEW